MIIALDVDGVLRNFTGRLTEVYKEDYPTHNVKPITEWGLEHFFPLGKEIYDYAFEYRAQSIFQTAKPIGDVKAFSRQLRELGNTVIISTSQPIWAEEYTCKWLKLNGVVYDGILFSSVKTLLYFDIALDDGEHNLIALDAKRPGKAICFDQPWNQGWNGKRVKSYQQFIDLLTNFNPTPDTFVNLKSYGTFPPSTRPKFVKYDDVEEKIETVKVKK